MSNKQTIKGFWEVTRQVLPVTPPSKPTTCSYSDSYITLSPHKTILLLFFRRIAAGMLRFDKPIHYFN